MPKFTFGHGKLAPVLIFAVVGCTGGALEQPTSPELAMTLRVHLAAPAPDATTEIGIALGPIPYCPVSYWPFAPNSLPPPLVYPPDRSPLRPLDRSGAVMELPVSSRGYLPFLGCTSGAVPLVRFFQPGVFLFPMPSGGAVVPWTSRDTIIAYADEAMTFTPFGPTEQPIALPTGYSILRRACGSTDESWHLQVGAPDAPIAFYPPVSPYYPHPFPLASALLEQSERALLEDCGIQPPPPDLGSRISFDRPVSLVFSGNGQELLFLLPIDPTDPAQNAALRSANLADGSVREIGIIPYGRDVQTGETGDIYVGTQTSMIQLMPQPDGSARSRSLPFSEGRVSPDGHWIAYFQFPANPGPGNWAVPNVWDVAAGVAHVIDNPHYLSTTWSPSSLLVEEVFGTGQQPGETYDLVEPVSGQAVETFHFYPQEPIIRLSWGTDGPVGLVTPTSWVPERQSSAVGGSSGGVFGLLLRDPHSGSGINVLDAQAGSISFAASTTGTALLWARKCLGLFDTVCSFDLHRVTVPAGDDQIVAVADNAALVAVSPSGDRIAIAARDGIYVRDLP